VEEEDRLLFKGLVVGLGGVPRCCESDCWWCSRALMLKYLDRSWAISEEK
jgi:hypothetical protein